MKRCTMIKVAAVLVLAAGHPAVAQSYTPTPPIARPSVLPKPVANRLAPRPEGKIEQAVIKPSDN
ncbi:MAG TPA: hypothetical protein VK862_13245 [Afifellaceae bacterium]|nr:hypothetical protein [Afifellaceae bacterium]